MEGDDAGAGSGEPMRVLLVDDQPLMLQALRVFVDSDPGFTVVGEATNGVAAVTQARALLPDVVVMDLQMPQLDGIQATQQILEALPGTTVIAMTTFHSEDYVIPSLRAGASGYLLKDSAPEELLAGIRDAVSGQFAASPRVTEVLVRSVLADPRVGATSEPAATPESLGLSEREMSVIRLLCQGYSNREIGQELFLAEPTVKTHIGRIMTKLGVRDRVQIVIAVSRSGLIEL